MKKLIILILPLLPVLIFAQNQTVWDSCVQKLSNGQYLRRVISTTYVTPSVGYQFLVRDTLTKKKGLVNSTTLLAGYSLVNHTHDYTTLTNKPTIPTNTNQLTNGAAFLVASDITGKLNKTDTSAMLSAYLTAIQGKQASLGFTPYNATNPSGYISAVPAQTFASITGKPTTIAGYGITDAFDGTWSSLTGKPTTTSFLSNSTNKNFVTDAQLTIIVNTVGSNNGDNAVNSTYANDYRAGNFIAGTNYLAPNGSVAAVTGILPFASNAGSSAATSATTGTMTVNMTTPIITITPSNACTFNGSGGVTGQRATFVITTSGVSSFTLTWGTNFKTTGTLATGTTTAKIFTVTFLCTNGTQWVEQARTAAQ